MSAGQQRVFAGLDGLAPRYSVRMWGVVSGSRCERRRKCRELGTCTCLMTASHVVGCLCGLRVAGSCTMVAVSQSVSWHQFLVLSGFAVDCHRG